MPEGRFPGWLQNGKPPDPPAARVLGIRIHALSVPELHRHIDWFVRRRAHALVLYANAHAMNLCRREPWLREQFNRAELVICDGAGVMLAAKILGKHIPRRITYADWMWSLASFACRRAYSLYFLGARPGVAERAAERLRGRFPALRIAGTHHGYFDKRRNGRETEAVIREINRLRPDILFVGFGMPLQERWLNENWERIDAAVALTVGGAFDIISGNLRRGPRWMTENHLEWLARLFTEPRRLWKRYLLGNPLFVYHVLRERITGRPDP